MFSLSDVWELLFLALIYPLTRTLEIYMESLQKPHYIESVVKYHCPSLYKIYLYLLKHHPMNYYGKRKD